GMPPGLGGTAPGMPPGLGGAAPGMPPGLGGAAPGMPPGLGGAAPGICGWASVATLPSWVAGNTTINSSAKASINEPSPPAIIIFVLRLVVTGNFP
ncbi:MAG: hypothetical protein KAW89_06155, partial [Armatimonadetes bacterium]|nr:hypothetical protein [Armatimonadota bacterium]